MLGCLWSTYAEYSHDNNLNSQSSRLNFPLFQIPIRIVTNYGLPIMSPLLGFEVRNHIKKY